jgi:hypothetical protein
MHRYARFSDSNVEWAERPKRGPNRIKPKRKRKRAKKK